MPSENWMVPWTMSRLVSWAGCARPRSAPLPCRRPAPRARSRGSRRRARRAGQAGEDRHVEDADGDDGVERRGPEDGGDQDGDEQRREGEDESLPRMIISSSSEPRRAAATSPSGTPTPMPMPTATSATAIEIRAPTIIIDSTSRPNWSVPSQCAAEGACSLSGMSSAATS